jgi:hydroxymethylpyrimidine pyrophosphatase-like HAD family hydrolase
MISFDFDDTLAELRTEMYGQKLYPRHTFIDLLKEYHALGFECIILTARDATESDLKEIKEFLERHNASHCVSEVVFTFHEKKGPIALELGVILHYDDCPDQLESVRSQGIQAISSLP